MDIIDEKRFITTGEDNNIMVWNYKSHKCEHQGIISPLIDICNNSDKTMMITNYKSWNKSWAVAYQPTKGHVAIGICNGRVSIRENIKNLNIKVLPNIDLGRVPVTELKYNRYGTYLAVALQMNIIYILDPNNNYTMLKSLELPNISTYIKRSIGILLVNFFKLF